jgi:hypothetical protein
MKSAAALSISALVVGLVSTSSVSAESIVPTPPFKGIGLEGGGHVVLKQGAKQEVRLIEGSTSVTRFEVEGGERGSLHIETCHSDCPHEYRLEVEITTPDIDALAVNGGGSIDAGAAFADRHELSVAVNGGGNIDARGVDAGHVNAAVHGGGHIRVKPKTELNAAVAGGGRIEYWGDPMVTKVVVGGGDVEQGR